MSRRTGKAGRPPFKVTATMRRRVEEYISVGMSIEEVARAIGCSAPTLKKHCSDELAIGLAKKRAEVIAGLYKLARKGNIAALKKLEEMTRIAQALAAPDKATADTTAKLGKKQIAAIAATKAGGAGSDWGDDLTVPDGLPN